MKAGETTVMQLANLLIPGLGAALPIGIDIFKEALPMIIEIFENLDLDE